MRGQVRGTVAAQATILIVIALAAGVPVGVTLGRWIWTGFANQLGMVPQPAVRGGQLALLLPAALILANAIAAFPARSAARVRPALVLRAE